ncbi:MAG: hypothetical protein B7Z66_02965 [Chromatiales bacterium 21-64-14]|nr:MAG: hypothetical protein B7Z66_02965 [Chromatiales bacterium 21-64-14]HQU15708.1 DedA family protein [Gammaproteobacteria bacterium]
MTSSSLIHGYLALAQPYLSQYGYGAVFAGILLEDFGIPSPGEPLLIAGALLASQGQMNIAVLLPTAWGAAVLGDNIGYAIGRFGGRRLVLHHGRRVGIREHHVERVEHFFQRHGGGLVVVARFFEVLRQLNGIIAGIGGMPWWRFFFYNALGAALWVGAWGFGVYRLGQNMETSLLWLKLVEPYAIAAGLVAVTGLVFYLFQRRKTGVAKL